jgi:hypothetical protein
MDEFRGKLGREAKLTQERDRHRVSIDFVLLDMDKRRIAATQRNRKDTDTIFEITIRCSRQQAAAGMWMIQSTI